MRRRMFMLAMMLLAAACAASTQAQRPEKEEYPASKFMTATGMGNSEGEAKNQAVSELSRIFESRVSSDTLDRIKAVIPSKGRESITQTVESSIKVVSEVQLKGVEVPKTWFDDKKRLYYATAVLDRAKARDTWQRDIANIDQRIEGEYRAMNAQPSKFLKLKSTKKIVGMWVEREVIVSRLRVLGFGEGSTASYDMKAVFGMQPEIKRTMLVNFSLSGDKAKPVGEAMASALSDAGYIMTPDRGRADIVVSGSVHVEPVKLNNPGWEFARASLALKITDVASGNTVGELSDNVRASHVSYSEAANKAVRQLSTSASEKVVQYFEE